MRSSGITSNLPAYLMVKEFNSPNLLHTTFYNDGLYNSGLIFQNDLLVNQAKQFEAFNSKNTSKLGPTCGPGCTDNDNNTCDDTYQLCKDFTFGGDQCSRNQSVAFVEDSNQFPDDERGQYIKGSYSTHKSIETSILGNTYLGLKYKDYYYSFGTQAPASSLSIGLHLDMYSALYSMRNDLHYIVNNDPSNFVFLSQSNRNTLQSLINKLKSETSGNNVLNMLTDDLTDDITEYQSQNMNFIFY